MEQLNGQLFFDPFAETGETAFDAGKSFQVLFERYENHAVTHDYTADRFVADTEALMLDAQFVGQFQQMEEIVTRMHDFCMDDHGLREQVSSSSLFAEDGRSHDGHDHASDHHASETSKAESKKKKDKKVSTGWLRLLLDQYNKKAKRV